MSQFSVKTTKKREVVDITGEIQNRIGESSQNPVFVFIKHTTAALTFADLDPGTDLDFLEFLDKITPNIKYRHPHDPGHTPDHMLASLVGQSVFVPIKNGKLDLGTWQRIILVEFDGPREREIVVV